MQFVIGKDRAGVKQLVTQDHAALEVRVAEAHIEREHAIIDAVVEDHFFRRHLFEIGSDVLEPIDAGNPHEGGAPEVTRGHDADGPEEDPGRIGGQIVGAPAGQSPEADDRQDDCSLG